MRRSRLALALLGVAAGHSTSAQNPVDTLGSVTANSGMYTNRIPAFTGATPYVEICFKGGQQLADLHPAGGPTDQGESDFCNVGDTGWVMELNERPARTWTEARAECLLLEMRLPEPFEFQYSCARANVLGLNAMVGDWEWISNSTLNAAIFDMRTRDEARISAAIGGFSSCTDGGIGNVGDNHGVSSPYAFRCVK